MGMHGAVEIDDVTVEALGRLTEALETTERARGHLYAMHQLTGEADFKLDGAVASCAKPVTTSSPTGWRRN